MALQEMWFPPTPQEHGADVPEWMNPGEDELENRISIREVDLSRVEPYDLGQAEAGPQG